MNHISNRPCAFCPRARWTWQKLDSHRQNGGHQKRGAVQELLFQLQEAPQPGQPAPAAQEGKLPAFCFLSRSAVAGACNTCMQGGNLGLFPRILAELALIRIKGKAKPRHHLMMTRTMQMTVKVRQKKRVFCFTHTRTHLCSHTLSFLFIRGPSPRAVGIKAAHVHTHLVLATFPVPVFGLPSLSSVCLK